MHRFSRRSLLLSAAVARLFAEGPKGASFPSEWKRYPDPTTELEVYRLTEPDHSSTLPAYYNRVDREEQQFAAVLFGPGRHAAGLSHGPEERFVPSIDGDRRAGRHTRSR